jgi:predicted N-formylglutamate amidohydrolase
MPTRPVTLLAPDEPPAFEVMNPEGPSRYVLLCDHASSRMPRRLGTLGLAPAEVQTHIGWDIGAAEVARAVSSALDAPLVLSGYSRLAIDCNRPPGAPASIPAVTCDVAVPGNADIGPIDRAAREEALFWPYHRAVQRVLADRDARGVRSVILSIHSFTPSLYGEDRPWHYGVMYGKDRRLAAYYLEAFAAEPGLVVGDNRPYHVTDQSDYGVPTYAERPGRPGILLEIRQDLIDSTTGALRAAEVVARVGLAALDRLSAQHDSH